MAPNSKRNKCKLNRLRLSPSKTYSLSADIVTRILGYITIDTDYSRNMYNFTLVETSWRNPATDLLHTHLKFASYDNLIKYVLKIDHHPDYANLARSIYLLVLSGPSNPEIHLCHLIQSCPNIVSFKALRCPPNWINGPALLAMGTHWPHLVELVLYSRDHCDGEAFTIATRGWQRLSRLDLTNISRIEGYQFYDIMKNLPNLRFLRLSPVVNNPQIPDLMSDSLLRPVSEMSQLEVIDFNRCTLFSDIYMLNYFGRLRSTLKCLKMTGCNQISSITLASLIFGCTSLRFVDICRSSFNDEALDFLCATRTCQRIEQFAMSNCSDISLERFRLFANMLGSHVSNRHVKKCTIYMQGMMSKWPRKCKRQIERSNPGLIIDVNHEAFLLDEVSESIVRSVV